MKIGIVGHRFFNEPGVEKFVTDQCHEILLHFQNKYQSVEAVSALAEGADTFFAEAALDLHIPLNVVTPFNKYPLDFETGESLSRYHRLRKAAKSEMELNFTEKSEEAYYEAMQWVVMQSDILVVAWDGEWVNRKGGTADAVRLAKKMHKDWIHINVSNLTTICNLKNGGNRKE